MEYTGKFRSMYSSVAGKQVDILKYTSKDKYPYCDCDRCGKPIIKTMYVVQDAEDDTVLFYLGSECIKHLT